MVTLPVPSVTAVMVTRPFSVTAAVATVPSAVTARVLSSERVSTSMVTLPPTSMTGA